VGVEFGLLHTAQDSSGGDRKDTQGGGMNYERTNIVSSLLLILALTWLVGASFGYVVCRLSAAEKTPRTVIQRVRVQATAIPFPVLEAACASQDERYGIAVKRLIGYKR
jgi:hypothetical protein